MAESTHSTRAPVSSQAISAKSVAFSAKASGAEALGYASEEEQESMMSEFGALFESLDRESKRRLIPVLDWLVKGGDPETDPRNGDPWWDGVPRAAA